jgi:hypothetical protein
MTELSKKKLILQLNLGHSNYQSSAVSIDLAKSAKQREGISGSMTLSKSSQVSVHLVGLEEGG